MAEPDHAHNLKDPRFLGVVNDLLKHFITLSSAAIVILVGFIEELAQYAKWRLLVAFALLSFALTVVTSVLIYSAIARQLFKERPKEDIEADLDLMGTVIQVTWFSFIGLLFLVVLAIRNLY